VRGKLSALHLKEKKTSYVATQSLKFEPMAGSCEKTMKFQIPQKAQNCSNSRTNISCSRKIIFCGATYFLLIINTIQIIFIYTLMNSVIRCGLL